MASPLSLFELILLAAALAMDAMAVALASAAAGHAECPKARFRLIFHFGLFQGMMPMLGWALGQRVIGWMEAVDHWIAFGLLAFIAWRMIQAGRSGGGESMDRDPSKGMRLVMLSTATSIDALAVGFSLSALRVGVLLPSVVIGLTTSILCLVAILFGRRLGEHFGDRAQIGGGLMLLLIAARILVDHLFLQG